MITSIFIIAVSTGLFLYWFRYTCVLILSARTARDYSQDVAAANQLSFIGVEQLLETPAAVDLNAIERSLDRDFRLVTALATRAGQLKIRGNSLEEVMLRVDFRIMQLGFNLSHRILQSRSRAALAEMSRIVEHFANVAGERAPAGVKA